jgi:hypothetical protein
MRGALTTHAVVKAPHMNAAALRALPSMPAVREQGAPAAALDRRPAPRTRAPSPARASARASRAYGVGILLLQPEPQPLWRVQRE